MRDRTDEAHEDLESSLNGLANNRLVHLYDILTDHRRELSHYYGENAGSFNNTEPRANRLARDFEEPVSEFLHRDSNDFTRTQRNRRALDTILLDQGLSFDEIEEYDPTYTEYLLILYHLFYDAAEQELKEYQYLAAKTLLFQERSGLVFDHYQPLSIEEKPLKRKCQQVSDTLSKGGRNFHIEPLLIESGEEAILKFYWERNRNPEMVFKDRLPEDHPKAGEEGVTHRPAYPIKTITVKLENEDDHSTIRLSKGKSGWESKLTTFFNMVYNLSDPFETFEPKRDEAVDQVIDAVRQAAKDAEEEEESDEDTVFDAAKEEIDDLREDVVEKVREEEGDEEADSLKKRYTSIEPTGIIIEDDDETLSEEFSIKSKATLKEWEAMNEGGSTIVSHELNNADEDKVGIRFRGNLRGEDKHDEFILMDGTWHTERGGGVPQETSEMLNRLLGGSDE